MGSAWPSHENSPRDCADLARIVVVQRNRLPNFPDLDVSPQNRRAAKNARPGGPSCAGADLQADSVTSAPLPGGQPGEHEVKSNLDGASAPPSIFRGKITRPQDRLGIERVWEWREGVGGRG